MKQYKNKNWLNREYWKEELCPRQIAQLCNCDSSTIWNWLIRLNVKMRSKSEAQHLRQANYCNLSEEARQWIDGELLGDGCLLLQSKYSAQFHYSSKHKEYIQYVSDTLKSFGIKQSGKIRKHYQKDMDYYNYRYASLSYAELLPIRKCWYPKDKKIIPRDLKLTPLVLRQEMIGDGCLHHPKKKTRRPYITLSTNGFPVPDVKWLVNKLNKLGFKSTRHPSDNSVRISTYSTKNFLNYIGNSPVKCYEYKFNY